MRAETSEDWQKACSRLNARGFTTHDFAGSDAPRAGYWECRYPNKDSGYKPVHIIECWDEDESGNQVSDSTWEALIEGQPVEWARVWPYCANRPLSFDQYRQKLPKEPPMQAAHAEPLEAKTWTQEEYNARLVEAARHAMPDAMQTTDIDKLAEALAKAQGDIEGASKDSLNPHFKNAYADLASVWNACRKALSANGLAVVQTTKNGHDGGTITVVTTLMHASGQWIRSELTMKAQQNTPQGIGSTLTYARRYALAAMVGVAPEDDDGEGGEGRNTKREPRPTPKPNGRTDEKLAKATEWANHTAQSLDLATTVKEVHELVNSSENFAKLQWLHDNHNDVYMIVDRARERAAARITKAAA